MELGNIATTAWFNQLRRVMDVGEQSEPRGKKTKELIGVMIGVNMRYPIVSHPVRGLNYTFMAAEALWIISGRSDLEFHKTLKEKLEPFSDEKSYMAGAYGPPFIDQLPYVIGVLGKDPDSRQAVITIWRPRPYPSKDIPCTISIQFLIRNNILNACVSMRSSDVWLGIPYDLFSYTCMSAVVALNCGVPNLGILRVFMGSSHLYEENFDKANAVLNVGNQVNAHVPFDILNFKSTQRLRSWLGDAAEVGNNLHSYKILTQVEPFEVLF